MFRFFNLYLFFTCLLFATNVHASVCPINFEPRVYFIKCDGIECNQVVKYVDRSKECFSQSQFHYVLYFSKEEIQNLLQDAEISDSKTESGTYQLNVYYSPFPFSQKEKTDDYSFKRIGNEEEFGVIVNNLENEVFNNNLIVVTIFAFYFIAFIIIVVFLILLIRFLFSILKLLKHSITSQYRVKDAYQKNPITIKTVILNFPIAIILVFFTFLIFALLLDALNNQ